MSDREAPARRASADWFLLAAAFGAPLVLRALSYVDRVLDRDEAYWLSAAMRMRDADVPMYVAGWDTKPPAVFAFYRVALAVCPGAPMLAAHALAAVVAGAACVIVVAAARRFGGVLAGVCAGALFALLDSTGPVRALAANTELLAYVPIAAVALVASAWDDRRAWRPFAAGACVAAAALAKLPALAYAPCAWLAIVAAPGGRSGAWRGLLWGVVGAVAVIAPVFAWLRLAGAWDDFVACNLTISANRAASGVGAAADASYSRWLRVLGANPGIALGAASLLALAVVRRGGSEATTLRAAGPLVAAGVVAAVAGGLGFQHYLQLAYPPLAVVAGVGVASVVASVRGVRGRWAAGLAVAAVVGGGALLDRANQWRSRNWVAYEGPGVDSVRARIDALTRPEERIFVWGMHPDLYVACRRAPATRFTACGWLVGTYTGKPSPTRPEPFELVPGSWDLLFRDLDESRPPVIVDSVPAGVHGFDAYPISRFPRLEEWLSARYAPEAERPGGYVVWRRIDAR